MRSYKVCTYAGQSQRDGKVENSLNVKIFLTCIGVLYIRERIGLRAPYLLCVRYIPVPTDPVIGKTWTCIL